MAVNYIEFVVGAMRAVRAGLRLVCVPQLSRRVAARATFRRKLTRTTLTTAAVTQQLQMSMATRAVMSMLPALAKSCSSTRLVLLRPWVWRWLAPPNFGKRAVLAVGAVTLQLPALQRGMAKRGVHHTSLAIAPLYLRRHACEVHQRGQLGTKRLL